MPRAYCTALVATLVLLPVLAAAQDAPSPPWAAATPTVAPTVTATPTVTPAATPTVHAPDDVAPSWGSAWPVPAGTTARAPQRRAEPAPEAAVSADALREPPDPGAGHFFQMPTARVLRMGDVLGHYVGDLGWVGVRFGLTRRIDVGVGVPYYFLGVSADARVAFVQQRGFAASWWGYVSVPLQPGGARSTTNLGFTWAHAGMGWITGPLVSVWGERAGFHAGVHLAQRTGLGGVWLMSHATVEFRVVPGMKLVGQAIAFYELAAENGTHEAALVGNGQARFLPYVLGGLRFYTRRFAADFGLLAPLDTHDPLYTERLPVLPWVSLAHLF